MEIEDYILTEKFLKKECDWLEQLIRVRLEAYFNKSNEVQSIYNIKPPIIRDKSTYERFLLYYELDFSERVIVAMISASIMKPEMFDIFQTKNEITGSTFTEFGGKMKNSHFIPTYRTAVFILNENKSTLPFVLFPFFEESHPFTNYSLLHFSGRTIRSRIESTMRFSSEAENLLFTGHAAQPDFNSKFPAKKITTNLEWSDLVINNAVMDQVQEINTWLLHGTVLMNDWGLNRRLKPGYRVLFYGPPGTGKTLTATLLGKASNRDVYKVDLSMLVSKYIGETEKNLDRIFDQAQRNDWILFFDEADALFGKRTNIKDVHDKYANQEVSYLLQRIEDFPGVVIVVSNLKANIDDAFIRRFQSMIHFTIPGPKERYQLWQNAFSGTCKLSSEIDLRQIAEKYELSGGSINKILRNCALAAVSRDDSVVTNREFLAGIRKAFKKGK